MAARDDALKFWAAAVLAAAGFAAAVWLIMPYEALAAHTAPQRFRIWLLTVWTAGVLAIMFGAAALIAHGTGLGVRDIARAGSLRAALDERRSADAGGGTPFHRNFGWWIVVTGFLLVAVYFVVWLTGS